MAPRSDLLDHYKLHADQVGDSVIHCSYRSDRARGLRKVKLEEKWDNVKPIGYGSFGEVWQQKRNDSNEHRAVKVLRKHQMKSWGIDYDRELEALAKFNTAQFRQEEVIVQFFGWWESEHSVHLAMEYFEMRDLSIFISEAKTSEQDAKDIAQDLLKALVMIHSQGFTHRDLKPQVWAPFLEDLFLHNFHTSVLNKYWVKLGDFGISKRVSNPSTALRTEVGTRAFSAPETTPDDYEETFQYTNAVDMWSLGCVIYNVLAHSLPYPNSRAKSFPFPTQPLKDRVNDQGVNILGCLLRVDPSTRWTAQKAVTHPWLHASGEGSSAGAEDATKNASPIAQRERSSEGQDKSHRSSDQVDMPTSISSVEKTRPRSADRTERSFNQSTTQSSRHPANNGQSNSSSTDVSGRRTSSNMLSPPSKNGISDSFENLGTETLTPRRARYHLPKDSSRGLHEGTTIKKPSSSPTAPTIRSRPSNIGLETSSSNSDDEDGGATRKEPLVKVHQNVLPMRRPQRLEGQAAENTFELLDILRYLDRQESPPDQNRIARALEFIRKGVNTETRIDGHTALHLAVRCYLKKGGAVSQILHELLERGADVDARDEFSNTALHIAVLPSLAYNNEDGTEIVKQLLKYKPDVNAKHFASCTPLHWAAFRSSGVCIDALLVAGARVNELDADGSTALHWVVYNEHHGETVAEQLILAGIDMNVIDRYGMTALHKARSLKKYEVIKVLEEAQKNIFGPARREQTLVADDQ